MDRNQFIAQLFLMFPRNFTEENAATWRRAYEQVLPIATDFDSLMQTVISEYENSSIPKPAWFKDKREIKEAIRQEKQRFENENPVKTKSVYAQIGGRVYEFGYNPETETEEQIKTALTYRFRTKNIIIKEKSAVYGGGVCEQRPTLDNFT